MRILILTLAAGCLLAGCGGASSYESDVTKRARYMCRIQQLEASGKTDEAGKVRREMEAFDKKMEKKYKDKEPTDEQYQKGVAIVDSVMNACK